MRRNTFRYDALRDTSCIPIPDAAHNGKSIAKYGYAFLRNRFGGTDYLSCAVRSAQGSRRWNDRLQQLISIKHLAMKIVENGQNC